MLLGLWIFHQFQSVIPKILSLYSRLMSSHDLLVDGLWLVGIEIPTPLYWNFNHEAHFIFSLTWCSCSFSFLSSASPNFNHLLFQTYPAGILYLWHSHHLMILHRWIILLLGSHLNLAFVQCFNVLLWTVDQPHQIHDIDNIPNPSRLSTISASPLFSS